MTSSSEDSFVLIEETINVLLDEDAPIIIDYSNDFQNNKNTPLDHNDKDQSFVFQVAPLDLKKDFVSILEAKKTFPISPKRSIKKCKVLELDDEPDLSNVKKPVSFYCCHGC
jgi:hypothetical protein